MSWSVRRDWPLAFTHKRWNIAGTCFLLPSKIGLCSEEGAIDFDHQVLDRILFNFSLRPDLRHDPALAKNFFATTALPGAIALCYTVI